MTVALAEKALTVSNGTVSGKYISQTEFATMAMSSGEEDPDVFTADKSDNENTMSAPTVDATNKNEHILSHIVWKSGANVIKVSQAFILQTAELTYKTLPKTYFTGSTKDVKFEKKVKKDSLTWAIWGSTAAAIKDKSAWSGAWLINVSKRCANMHDIEADAGEADVKCNWHAKCADDKCSEFTVYQNADKKYVRWTFPEKAIANGEDAKVAAAASGDEENNEPFAVLVLAVETELKAGDWWAATVEISTGSFKEDDVSGLKPDQADATQDDSGEEETTGEEAGT